MNRPHGWPVVSKDARVQAHYEAMRAAGEAHTIAEMLATCQPPMSNTDREFLEGQVNGSQFEGQEPVGDLYRREAAAAGVDVTGKVYLSGLAAYPGDPRAWVSGRGDVQKVCEERGWGCQGSVNVAVRPEEPAEVGVAPGLVERHTDEAMAALPPDAGVDRAALREEVRDRISPHWSKD